MTWSRVPAATTQLIVAESTRRNTDENTFSRWEKSGGCWVQLSSWWSLNGFKGWHERPWTGSLRSPIGVFSLTDAGGRLRNPGTAMRYHYGPKKYERGGYKISYPVQLYNYVIAINYNRRIGKPRVTQTSPIARPAAATGSISADWGQPADVCPHQVAARHNLALDATDCAAPDHHGAAQSISI